jgi:lipopolysaccharide/colanic/teichoic acid biosynthesis glycosyltransferase
MVEAMAAGRPVLACSQGGALEVVRDGETGLLVAPTEDSVRAALDRFARCRGSFDGEVLRNFAKRFDRRHFERRFAEAVEDACRAHRDTRAAGSNGVSRLRPPPICTELSAAGGGAEARRREANGAGPTVHANDRPSPGALAVKRCVDIALAATGLVLAAPLMAALGAWVRLDSRGPALFCQSRVGLGRRPFRLVKLRTMDGLGRVTRAGRFLRPLGLDELPQLWNVLRGDMSLIGPRPDVPERVTVFESTIPRYDDRHRMRPGITGLAQVNGTRGDASPMAERVRYDVEYVRGWSLAMDGRVLLRTVPAVLADTLVELGK